MFGAPSPHSVYSGYFDKKQNISFRPETVVLAVGVSEGSVLVGSFRVLLRTDVLFFITFILTFVL